MTVAATLLEAADLAQGNLFPLWVADTLQARVIAFWQAVNPVFSDQTPNNHPVGNWISVIAAFAPNILVFEQALHIGIDTLGTYQTSVQYIYRMFKLANSNLNAGLISTAQRDALLTAYNAQFA